MELRMVVRRTRGQSLTVLGDIAQRTAEARLSTWEAVLGDAGVRELAVEELLVSYRVPEDFLRFGLRFADGTALTRLTSRGAAMGSFPSIFAVTAKAAGVRAKRGLTVTPKRHGCIWSKRAK